MNHLYRLFALLLIVSTVAACESGDAPADEADAQPMSFFLTSAGPGNGADLGGLEGADQHCAMLASEVGAGDRTWRAYLSVSPIDSVSATDNVSVTDSVSVNARDRIGRGPWYNAAGELVAEDVEHLHAEDNLPSKEISLNERGEMVNGRGDEPNRHDILTGSRSDGTAFDDGEDHTCSNWTSSGEGSAHVGHHDREGGGEDPTSWNAAHGSRGCSQADLQGTGGDGLFYCFAAD